MNETTQNILNALRQHLWYGLLLGATLLFFLYKGILYATIGSYVPLALILVILILLMLGLNRSFKAFRQMIGLWSVLIIIWASVRLLLSIMNQFVKPIPEAHVDAQLGLSGVFLSLLFLINGIFLWKHKKRLS